MEKTLFEIVTANPDGFDQAEVNQYLDWFIGEYDGIGKENHEARLELGKATLYKDFMEPLNIFMKGPNNVADKEAFRLALGRAVEAIWPYLREKYGAVIDAENERWGAEARKGNFNTQPDDFKGPLYVQQFALNAKNELITWYCRLKH